VRQRVICRNFDQHLKAEETIMNCKCCGKKYLPVIRRYRDDAGNLVIIQTCQHCGDEREKRFIRPENKPNA
jgi:hypothetical protein